MKELVRRREQRTSENFEKKTGMRREKKRRKMVEKINEAKSKILLEYSDV